MTFWQSIDPKVKYPGFHVIICLLLKTGPRAG